MGIYLYVNGIVPHRARPIPCIKYKYPIIIFTNKLLFFYVEEWILSLLLLWQLTNWIYYSEFLIIIMNIFKIDI